ncbi:hypothetical protein PAXRUDRAFT_163699, partial [Paxillus rubicundulus Ve08.2h10]
VMVPGAKCLVDGKEFFVMGVIVEFRSGEGPGVECDRAEFDIRAADGKDASDGIVRGVSLNDDRGIRHPMPAFVGEVPQGIFVSEASERNNNVRVVINEMTIEVGKTEE